MAERDAGSVDVEPVVDVLELQSPARQHGEYLHRERLIDLDQAQIVETVAGSAEELLDRAHRSDAHARRDAAHAAPAPELADRHQPHLVQSVLGHYQAGRGGVVLLAGVARRHSATGHYGA